MERANLLREIRKMRFEELYERRLGGKLTISEAADILGVDQRTFRRWSRRYQEEGAEGLVDRRIGMASHRRASIDEVLEMLNLFETRYFDFNVRHFHQKLKTVHGSTRCYTWTKNRLQAAGKISKGKSSGTHRRKRPRKPLPGMMLHQDGSTHEWVPGVKWDLIITFDDATSEIYSAFFVEQEGTMSTFMAIEEVIKAKGLFCSLYTDRGSHYWLTREVDGKVDKMCPTQVNRALKQLGIELIPAYSPEARGRCERQFGTLQGRWPQELRLAGITEMCSANRYVKEILIPRFNKEFRVKAEADGSAFVRWIGGNETLSDILCVHEDRIVGKDNTVRFNNKSLQIPANKYRYHYVKATVRVHEYPDASLAVFHGPRCLARYNAMGELLAMEADRLPANAPATVVASSNLHQGLVVSSA
jgi:transposase